MIARDSKSEAKEVLCEIVAKANTEAVEGFRNAVKQAGKSTSDSKGRWADSEFQDLVQYNDGFRTGLIGTQFRHPEPAMSTPAEWIETATENALPGERHGAIMVVPGLRGGHRPHGRRARPRRAGAPRRGVHSGRGAGAARVGAPRHRARAARRARCEPARSAAGQALTVSGWLLRLLAWTFATLFVVGFTGAVRKT